MRFPRDKTAISSSLSTVATSCSLSHTTICQRRILPDEDKEILTTFIIQFEGDLSEAVGIDQNQGQQANTLETFAA